MKTLLKATLTLEGEEDCVVRLTRSGSWKKYEIRMEVCDDIVHLEYHHELKDALDDFFSVTRGRATAMTRWREKRREEETDVHGGEGGLGTLERLAGSDAGERDELVHREDPDGIESGGEPPAGAVGLEQPGQAAVEIVHFAWDKVVENPFDKHHRSTTYAMPICGGKGSERYRVTREKAQVTCPECEERM